MNKNVYLISVFVLSLFASQLFGQARYLDEIFAQVSVTEDVQFSTNFGFFSGFMAQDTLRMDIYEPMGDTVSERPLIILMHPGSYLPKGVNTLPFGDRKDSAIVEMCTQFAKRGFVAAASSYRLGWNPASADQDVRSGTIITATVLGALDGKNCIKFFRQDAAASNTYRIDPGKITIGGTNTGGYVALAANNFDEPNDLTLLKFRNSQTGESYFDTTAHGNFDGVGGTTNNEQYLGINGDPNLVLNLGGAAGDTSIQNSMDAPIISITGKNDPLTPDSVGVVVVSGAGGVVPVIEVHGGLVTSRYATTLGINSVFSNVTGDPYTAQAEANLMKTGKNPADYLGYYQIQDPATGYEPWGWYDPMDPNIAQGSDPNGPNYIPGATGSGSRANPFQTKDKALMHIDTVMGFFCPRAVAALQLFPTAIDQDLRVDAGLDIYPNPARERLILRVGNARMPIIGVELMDVTGRVVHKAQDIRTLDYVLDRAGIADGLYIVKVDFAEGSITEKVYFN